MRSVSLSLSVTALFLSPLALGQVRNVQSGFFDFNFYPVLSAVDNDSVMTVNLAANLNSGWSYFSLTNFYNQTDNDEFSDTNSFYTEQNIRWKIRQSPFDLTAQFNLRSGEDNDRHRFGFRWRMGDSTYLKPVFKALNLSWSMNFHVLQIDDTDAHEWQLEHVYLLRFPYLTERLYLGGFIDHTFGESLPDTMPENPFVSESQLGYRLVENMFLVIEYRYNQYRLDKEENIALGLEYKLLW